MVFDKCIVVFSGGKLAEAGRELVAQIAQSEYFASITVVAPEAVADKYIGPGRARVTHVHADPSEDPGAVEAAASAAGVEVAFVLVGSAVEEVGADGEWKVLATELRGARGVGSMRDTDCGAVAAVAEALRAAGVRHLHAVSAQGADANSPRAFLRVKGEAERALAALYFQRLALYRPGYLRGAQAPSVPDLLAAAWALPMDVLAPRDASIRPRSLAAGMLAAATATYAEDVRAYENAALLRLAGSGGDGWAPMEHVPELDTLEWDEGRPPPFLWRFQEEAEDESVGAVVLAMLDGDGGDKEDGDEDGGEGDTDGRAAADEREWEWPEMPDLWGALWRGGAQGEEEEVFVESRVV